MNEFLLIFRRDYRSAELQPTPEKMNLHLLKWQEWFESLASNDHLARKLQRWDGKGKIISKDKQVADGPYVEIKESIGGLIIIKAADYTRAVEIAKGCPIFELGGSVEVRMGGLNRE